MKFTDVFPNPVDKGFLRLTITSNPEEHFGYSNHIRFDQNKHQQIIEGKWDLKDGEIVVRFLHIRGGRTKTVVSYLDNSGFSCKIDDVDAQEGDYHMEVNKKRVEKHIKGNKDIHPALFCLFQLLDKLMEIKDEEIPIYFFFEQRVTNNPRIIDIIVKNKPPDVNMTKYCYSISYKLWESKRTEDLRVINKWMDELRSAISWANKRIQKDGFVKIPWGEEQRTFPIPISAIEGDVIYLESYGKENPKLPDFLSSIPFRKNKVQ